MKKLVLIAVLLIPALLLAAEYEIDQGAIELGGIAGFTSTGGDLYEDYEGKSVTMFSIMPAGHYFVVEGLGVGGTIGFSSASQGDSNESRFLIGPSVQYYFKTSGEKIFPLLGAAFLYASDSYDYGGGIDGTDTGTTIEFVGGALFKLVEHYGVKAGVFFDLDSVKSEGADESVSGHKFGVLVGFSGYIY